jgi:hypothetical protein
MGGGNISCSTVWLKNRSPTRALQNKTPLDASGKGKPNLADLHEFRAKVYVHTPAGKLDPRAMEAKFVGYDTEHKGYRIYWPEKCKVSVERNVKFHPNEVVIQDVQSEGETAKTSGQHIPTTKPDCPTPNPEKILNPEPTTSSESESEPPPAPRVRLPDGLSPPEPT